MYKDCIMAKHIGIVAVSSEGAALCYQTICQEAVPLMGKHNHPELSMHTFPLAEHVKHIVTGDREKLGKLMAESAQKLIDIGAEIDVSRQVAELVNHSDNDSTIIIAQEFIEGRNAGSMLQISQA